MPIPFLSMSNVTDLWIPRGAAGIFVDWKRPRVPVICRHVPLKNGYQRPVGCLPQVEKTCDLDVGIVVLRSHVLWRHHPLFRYQVTMALRQDNVFHVTSDHYLTLIVVTHSHYFVRFTDLFWRFFTSFSFNSFLQRQGYELNHRWSGARKTKSATRCA